MVKPFESVLSNGYILTGYPIGRYSIIDGVKLVKPKIISSLPKIFILFTNNTHEDSMVSLRKEAGFSITASNRNVGVTTQDIVDQVPNILRIIFDNKKVFDMLDWCKYDNLVIQDIWSTPLGYYEMFILEAYGDIAKTTFVL